MTVSLMRFLIFLGIAMGFTFEQPMAHAESFKNLAQSSHFLNKESFKQRRVAKFNQSVLLSFNEIKFLKPKQRNHYLRKITEAFSRLQKEERIAYRKSFFSLSLESILSFANASTRERLFCVGGGVPVARGPRCGAQSYCGYSCGQELEICNPCIFGVDKDTNEPFCFSNATNRKCFAEIRVGYDSRTDVVFDLENRSELTDIERAQIRNQFSEFRNTVEGMCRGQISVQERKQYIDEACNIIRRQTAVNRRRQNEEENAYVTTMELEIDENFSTRVAGETEDSDLSTEISSAATGAEQCDDSVREQNRIESHDVLYIGNSHSTGARRNDGRLTEAMISGLEDRNHRVDYYGACGYRALTWATGGRNACGYSSYTNGTFRHFSSSGNVPPVSSIYEPDRHDQVVINLGDNMFGWSNYRSTGPARNFLTQVDRLFRSMPGLSPCNCTWVGPTYHPSGRPYTKSDAHVDQMYAQLEQALGGRCQLIDSRPLLTPSHRNDGLHIRHNRESYSWGQGILNNLDFLREPTSVSPSTVVIGQDI